MRDLTVMEGIVSLALLALIAWVTWASRKSKRFRAGIFVERNGEDEK